MRRSRGKRAGGTRGGVAPRNAVTGLTGKRRKRLLWLGALLAWLVIMTVLILLPRPGASEAKSSLELALLEPSTAAATVGAAAAGASAADAEFEYDINGHWEGSITITDMSVVDPNAVPTEGNEGCGMALTLGIAEKLINMPMGLGMDMNLEQPTKGTSSWAVDFAGAMAQLGADPSIQEQASAAGPLAMSFTLDGTTLHFTPEGATGVVVITGTLSVKDEKLVMDGTLEAVNSGISTSAVFTVTSQEPGALTLITTTTTEEETTTETTEPTTEETVIAPSTTEYHTNTTVTTGAATGTSDGGQTGEEGAGTVPGPGSWWDWLKGTAAAGVVASGIGLLSTLGAGAAGVAPVAPPPPPPEPGFFDRLGAAWTEAKDTGSFFVQNVKDDVGQKARFVADTLGATATAEALRDAPAAAPFFVENVKDDMKSIGSSVSHGLGVLWDDLKKLKNPDTWVKGWENTKAMAGKAVETIEDIKDYLDTAEQNPGMLTHDALEAAQKTGDFLWDEAKEFAKDPLSPLRSIRDDFDKAMDPNNPVLERLGHSTIATLNAIGLIEGAGAAKELLEKGVGKLLASEADDLARAAAGKVDDAVEVAVGLEKTAVSAEEAVAGAEEAVAGAEAGGAKIPVVKEKPGFFNKVSPEKEAELSEAWAKKVDAAASKVDELEQGLAAADEQARIDAALRVQKDPLAVEKLNQTGDTKLIQSFNQEMGELHDAATEATRRELARTHGVSLDRVEFSQATKETTTIKGGMDKDLTFTVDGKEIDNRTVQEIYDRNFHIAAGSPVDMTPEQLAEAVRNKAVDIGDAEALGTESGEWQKIIETGEKPLDAETVARSTEFKAVEQFAKADQLANAGKVDEALAERYLGLREMGKEYTRQVQSRVDYLSQVYADDPDKLAWIQNRAVGVKSNIEEVNRMMAAGKSPVAIEQFLESKHTSSEELAKQLSDVYEVLAKSFDQ